VLNETASVVWPATLSAAIAARPTAPSASSAIFLPSAGRKLQAPGSLLTNSRRTAKSAINGRYLRRVLIPPHDGQGPQRRLLVLTEVSRYPSSNRRVITVSSRQQRPSSTTSVCR